MKQNRKSKAETTTSRPAIAKQVLAVRSSVPKWWKCLSCKKSCYDDNKDYYMLKDEVWKSIHPQVKGMLCMDCCEKKLGRKLIASDIHPCPLTTDINQYTRSILLNDR